MRGTPSNHEMPSDGTDATLLIVDDDQSLRAMLTLALEMDGFRVMAAGSAAQAIRLVAERAFDVVITDMRMETDASGYEVAVAAKSSEGEPAVVILSAYPLPPADWRRAGADIVLSKPTQTSTLLGVIRQLVERKRLDPAKHQL